MTCAMELLLGNKKEWSMLQHGWHLKALSQSVKATCYMVILFIWNGQNRQAESRYDCKVLESEGEKHRQGLLTGSSVGRRCSNSDRGDGYKTANVADHWTTG